MRTNSVQTLFTTAVLAGLACITGGARDCMGGDRGSISVGEHDGGEDLDASEPFDLGAPTDAGVPLDAEAPVDSGSRDSGTAPDAATTAVTGFTVVSIGNTDNDFRMKLLFTSDDRGVIAHYGEAGYPFLSYQNPSEWTHYTIPDIATADHSGCDNLPDMAIDSADRVHYVYLRPDVTGSCSGNGEVRYVLIDHGATTSAPVSLGTTLEYYSPFVSVGDDNVVHVAFVNPVGELVYKQIVGGVASDAISIGGVTYGRPLAMQMDAASRLHLLYVDDTQHLFVVVANATGFDAPIAAPGASLYQGAVAAIDSAGALHVFATTSTSAREYFTISPAGEWVSQRPPAFSASGVAINPVTNQPGIVAADHGGPVYYSAYSGSAWTSTITTSIPGAAEGVSPSVAFTSTGAPYLTFQGWGAGDLYYASPR